MFNDEDFEMNGDRIVGLKNMNKYDFYVLVLSEGNTVSAIPYLEGAGYTVFAETINTIIYVSPAYLSGQ